MMTASWEHLGCLCGHNDPTAVVYLRPSRYTKEFVDREDNFTICVMDKSFKKQMAYLGSVSGRDEDKIGKAGLTPVYADNTVYFEEAKLVLVCKKLYQSELQESGFEGREFAQHTVNQLLEAELKAAKKFGSKKLSSFCKLRHEYYGTLLKEFEKDFLKD